jgi:sulfite reductase alpha subunit
VVPFMKMETEEDHAALVDLCHRMLDFFADNALEHERTGEMIERIGLSNYLEGLELPLDINMISQPRTNSYIRTDGWDEEVRKWNEAKSSAAE